MAIYDLHGNRVETSGYFLDGKENQPYWYPPNQPASVRKPWDYNGLVAEYDKLVARHPNYIRKVEYGEVTETGYKLYHYIFEPEHYSKTFVLNAGVHGNEMDAKQQLLKICQIVAERTDEVGYRAWKSIRDDVRLFVIPCINPNGHDVVSMNIPYKGETFGLNANRNYDFVHQWALASAGVGGSKPWDVAETRHVRDMIDSIGIENIDFALDMHDGEDIQKHWWINYGADDDVYKGLVKGLLSHLNYKYEINEPIQPDCKDYITTGIAAGYFYHSSGISGGVNEWMGGIFGYRFDSKQMTMSLTVRGNVILEAYRKDLKKWRIIDNGNYFHWDYPKAFTRQGIRKDGVSSDKDSQIVTDDMIWDRWDALAEQNPTYIAKSSILGYDCHGMRPIYTYTVGSGRNKVLYVGGVMRFGGTHKIDEFAVYDLVSYLCNPYLVNQSRFLQNLKQNYTIVVLPCIDNIAANSTDVKEAGINNTVLSKQKWSNGQPTSYGLASHDVKIVKALIDSDSWKCIVSGGEIMTGYAGNPQDYSTDYQTQIVIPKNQSETIIADYKLHLESDRLERVSIEHTQGTTFGDYAYSKGIPTYFVQLKVSDKYQQYVDADELEMSEDNYMYMNYEAGRRIANIVNLFLI